jgi:hypothetical protein
MPEAILVSPDQRYLGRNKRRCRSMTTNMGIVGVRTNEKVEFNPQKDLLGKVDGFSVIPQNRFRDRDMRRRILTAI